MIIEVEEIMALQKRIDEINKTPLEQIVLVENGQKVEVDPKVLEEWKFVGLDNLYFITDRIFELKDTIYSHREPKS